MQSIDDADPKLGAEVWSTTPDVSFIDPLGHEHGWDEIASVVYGKLMGQTFSATGNPDAKNLFEIVAYLQKIEGIVMEVIDRSAA